MDEKKNIYKKSNELKIKSFFCSFINIFLYTNSGGKEEKKLISSYNFKNNT